MIDRFRNGLLSWALAALLLPALAWSQAPVEDSTAVAPPDLPSYDQPPMPADGYVWTPGYWAWSDDDQDFYWVPGTWVLAPQPEFLWTPGYWEVIDVVFFWHSGYWGRHVGFYGGINYGYGYRGDASGAHFSYNGGAGIQARSTTAQLAASGGRHIEAIPAQRQLVHDARSRPALHFNQNQGRPSIAATPKLGVWSGAGVVGARAGNPAAAMHHPGIANGAAPPGASGSVQPGGNGGLQAPAAGAVRPSPAQSGATSGRRQPDAHADDGRPPDKAPPDKAPPDKAPPRSKPPPAEHAAAPENRPGSPHPSEHPEEH